MTPSQSLKSTKGESASFTIVIVNRLEELVRLNEWVDQLAVDVGLSTEGKFQLELALAEAVANVIEYAFEDEVEHHITLRLEYYQGRFTIQLIDDGRPFDPTQYPAVEFPRTLDEAAKGGLGIHLIRNYADEVHYQRKDSQNILTMIVTTSS